MKDRMDFGNPPDLRLLVDSLPSPVFCLDLHNRFIEVNPAGERFFGMGRTLLARRRLEDVVTTDSPLLSLVQQVRERGASIAEHGVEVVTPRNIAEYKPGEHLLDIHAGPLAGRAETLLVVIQERSIAGKFSRQFTHRGAARSISAMAAMLAHEIKNPLSGIRGAAQLLNNPADAGSHELTTLIRDEVDRIVRLVERFEVFSEGAPPALEPVNIHEILDHVQRLARSGFARHIRFIDDFDPSLPPVHGNRDQLIQVLLNLVKNAAEAIGPETDNGEIVLSTAYSPGVHVTLPNTGDRTSLPLEVCVVDNGPGIPEAMLEHLFEPFMTTKSSGSGLGLATVAKIVSDHGGVIECDRERRGTRFRILLPMHRDSTRSRS
ncbi:MAG: PAS domain-containing protein [Proteobacteria bacterium]|nr:PAS domain-containing protein [Pseudomonadota bacterium]